MQSFKIGDVLVHRVVELGRMAVEPTWLLGNPVVEEIAAERHWLGDSFIEPETGKLIVSMHSYLLQAGGINILVDTCFGSERDRGASSPYHMVKTDYLGQLRATGVNPEDIDYVFCTHLHVDHVGWNTMDVDGRWVPTFPNARYLFSKADFDYCVTEAQAGRLRPANAMAFKECVLPIVDANKATFFDPQQAIEAELGHQFRVVDLPGHSPGHAGLHIHSAGCRGLITGDAIHHPIQLIKPEWYCVVDTDREAGIATRRKMIEDCTDTDLALLTAHFPDLTPSRLVSRNGTVRLEAAV